MTRPVRLGLLWLCLATWLRAEPTSLAIQPLGPVQAATLTRLCAKLQGTFNLEVKVLPAKAIPAIAFYEPRKRYRAEKILDELERMTPRGFTKILGVTVCDISTTKAPWADWGIFGLAYLDRRPSVISSFRLKRNAGEKLLRKRLDKVAVHEVAHTLGLDHCPTQGCVMEDAKGTIRTVDQGGEAFCPPCRKRIASFLR